MNTSVLTSLIAAGSALGGILLKVSYDAIIERLKSRREDQERFIQERKLAYDEFLAINKEHVTYRRKLQDVSLIARAGRQVKPEIISNFPDSPLPRLIDALEKMRRIAHTHDVVKVAERIVALHGDAASALRYYLTNDSLMYGLPLFLADRLGEDQVLEFIAAYRRDLGLGAPKGGPKDFPMIDRGFPMSMSDAEHVLRSHLQIDPDATGKSENWPQAGSNKQLVEDDIKALNTPRFRTMLLEETPNSPPVQD